MCSEFKYLETLEFSNHLASGFACEHSEDGRILIITDCGIYILQLCMKPEIVTPTICFKKYYIPVDKYVFSTNLGIDPNNFARKLSRLEFYELSLSVDVSPKLFLFHEMESKLCMAKWSPAFLDASNCLLGVLTDMGSLQIYARRFSYAICEDYISICNVSSHIINMSKMKWNNPKNLSPSGLLKELKERAQMRPTAFTWSKKFKTENESYALMVIGHLNKIITVWKVSGTNPSCKEGNVRCMLKINTNLQHITALYLHNTNDRGLILIGDYNGNVTAVPLMYITNKEIRVGDHMSLLMNDDQIEVKHVNILLHNGFMYIICVKGDSLLIYLLNKSGDILDNCNFEVGNLDIIGLEKIVDNILLVQTIAGLTKELKLACFQNKINVSWRHVYINVNWSMKKSHGMIFSRNKVLFGLLTYPCKIKVNKDDKCLVNLVLFQNLACQPFQLIMNNKQSTLYNFWDCFEILRVTSIIDKQFPTVNMPNTKSYSEFSLGKIKIYMHISKICSTIYDQQDTFINNINIQPYESLRYIFNVTLIIDRIKYLLKLKKEDNITEFQMQNLFLLNNYLKEYVLHDSQVNLLETFGMCKMIRETMTACNELEYPKMPICLICNDRLIDSSCMPKHFEQRCSMTLMPLDFNDGYKCPFCKCIAHAKLKEEVDMLLCPYCDIGMDYYTAEINDKKDRIDN